jgi:cell division protein FtsI/penicillin-binding protein 2
LLVTPLQITVAYAALATDGILRTPLAVHALRSADGTVEELFTPTATGVLPVSAATHALLQEATRQVIVSPFGTGRVPFAGTRLSVAGKSGTAEDSGEQSHALFVAYSGAQDPRLVVTVVLDVGESGSDEAGPIVRTVMERSLNSGWVE